MGYGQTPYVDPRGNFDSRLDGYDAVSPSERTDRLLRSHGIDPEPTISPEVRARIDQAWEDRDAIRTRLEAARDDQDS